MGTTPPPQLAPESLKNTPWNQASGNNSYESEILKDQVTFPFDDFLHFVFDFPKNWRDESNKFNAIIGNQKFKRLLSEFGEEVTHETHRYHPFVTLANHVLQELYLNSKSHHRISFCRNDRIPIRGSFATRIPDVVVVEEEVVMLGGRGDVENMSKSGPKADPFHWYEILAFFEFKLDVPLLNGARGVFGTSPSTLNSATKRSSATGSSATPRPIPSQLPFPDGPSPSSSIAHQTPSSSSRSPLSEQTSVPKKRSSTDVQYSESLQPLKKTRWDLYDSPPLSREEMQLKCASYALEMLSHGGLRNHVLSALVTDDQIELLYYDRSISVISDPLNFFQDHLGFVALLSGLAHLSSSEWGHETALKTPYVKREFKIPRSLPASGVSINLFSDSDLDLSNGKSLTLDRLLFHQHTLIGRGTCVMRARVKLSTDSKYPSDEWTEKPLIVKFSFSPETRENESDIVGLARKLARTRMHHWVLDHLPDILHAEEISSASIEIQQRLFQLVQDKYEKRMLRLLVQEELFPITALTTTASITTAIRGIFQCYRWLYEEAKILHRDISLNNLMYRKKENGDICGVLNDYDLSLVLTRETRRPTSKQRTGTQPYMAIDLLASSPPKHMYRHDLESLFYVIVFVTSRYDGGKEIPNPPLQGWLDYGGQDLVKEKTAFLAVRVPLPTPNYLKIGIWTDSMRQLFLSGIAARSAHDGAVTFTEPSTEIAGFDEETLGGVVSFDTFSEILQEEL